jgi:cyclic dehypoxanthinyl futalosine synthase
MTAGERLSRQEALSLWDLDLLTLGRWADRSRWRLHPEPRVTYVVDRNINYTNICVSGCRFCAFYRPPGSPEGYVLDDAALDLKLEGNQGIGRHRGPAPGGPQSRPALELLRGPGAAYPGLRPARARLFPPGDQLLGAPKRAPSPRILIRASSGPAWAPSPAGAPRFWWTGCVRPFRPNKCSAAEWLEVMAAAHGLGLKTTATMMFGHLETREERTEHLFRLRDLQDQTGGFTAFIPWSFQPHNTALGGEAAGSWEYLKTLAVSRLVLDNIENLQVSWVTQGGKIAQVALCFGANDFGSTMIEENVVAAAGVSFRLSEAEIGALSPPPATCPKDGITSTDWWTWSGGGGFPRAGSPCYRPQTLTPSPKPPPPTPNSGAQASSLCCTGKSLVLPGKGYGEGSLGGGQGAAPPGPPPKKAPPRLAVIARVGAHRDFLEKGVEYLGGEVHSTPFGDSNPVHLFRHQGLVFAVLSRHGEDRYAVSAAYVNDRANFMP